MSTAGCIKNLPIHIIKSHELEITYEWTVKDCLTRILNDDVIRGPVFSIASIEANLRIFQYNAGIICFSLDTDADEQNDPQFTWELSTRSSKLFEIYRLGSGNNDLSTRNFVHDRKFLDNVLMKNGDLPLVLCVQISKDTTGTLFAAGSSILPSRKDQNHLAKANYFKLATDFGKLLEQEAHTDLSFLFPSAGGTNLRAHRGILSVRSPVFAAMLAHQTTEAQDGRVQIEDIPVAVFKLLLSYIYTGNIADEKLSENALDLFKAADKYAIQGLKDLCEEVLSSTNSNAITVANMCKVLVTGEMYSTHVLKGAAANFIRRNGTAVMRTAAWRRLMLERPHLVDYVVARLAGVPPPQPGDYEAEKEEDESGREKVKDSSSRKDLPAGVQEEVNGHSKNEEDEDEPPNKKRTMK